MQALNECEELTQGKSKSLDLVLRSYALFLLLLVLGAIGYSHSAQWCASYLEPLGSTIGIAPVQTAIEHEYRFTEYRF